MERYKVLKVFKMDYYKEWIGFLRTISNHLLVFIVIGAGLTKLLIDKDFNIWFILGLLVIILLITIYTILSFIEIKEVQKLKVL